MPDGIISGSKFSSVIKNSSNNIANTLLITNTSVLVEALKYRHSWNTAFVASPMGVSLYNSQTPKYQPSNNDLPPNTAAHSKVGESPKYFLGLIFVNTTGFSPVPKAAVFGGLTVIKWQYLGVWQ